MANEQRLIDANEIKYTERKECGGHGLYFFWETVTKEDIDKMPTVDAVEVVRCKDCKQSYDGVANLMCGRRGQNINGIRLGGVSVEAEHFCSYGERREGE